MNQSFLRSRATWLFSVTAVTSMTMLPEATIAQQEQPRPDTVQAVALPLRPNFYVISGAGGNISVQIGGDGIVFVDTGSAATADAVLKAVRGVSGAPIRYIINTGPDP